MTMTINILSALHYFKNLLIRPDMQIILSVSILLVLVLFITWYIESRIYLFLFHRIIFGFVKNLPIIENKEKFFESELLDNNWKLIRDEVKSVLSKGLIIPRYHEVDPANYKISFSEGPAWKTIIIKGFSGWFENNCKMLPKTTNLLRRYPTVSSAIISIIEPGCYIPPHKGKFKGILRYHLGLMVPEGQSCFMKLAGEKIYWKEGKSILFDDTYEHEVTNQSDEYRVVLLLNVVRKMPKILSVINTLLYKLVIVSPVYKKGLKKGEII